MTRKEELMREMQKIKGQLEGLDAEMERLKELMTMLQQRAKALGEEYKEIVKEERGAVSAVEEML